MKPFCAVVLTGALLMPVPAIAFEYNAPGKLVPGASGKGRVDRKIYAPNILYPVRLADGQDSYLNSQVWGVGGMSGPGGGEADPRNYSMPWADNYCESRSWRMPLCPSGNGHQGVDIRGPQRVDNRWDLIAVEDGVITNITSNTTITLRGNSGTRYRYLHAHPGSFRVRVNDNVRAGQVIARMSNIMSGRPLTTIHLHFDIEQTLLINGSAQRVFVPPYTSLVEAYRKLKGLPPMAQGGNLGVDGQREKP